jgi:hypothetical protein
MCAECYLYGVYGYSFLKVGVSIRMWQIEVKQQKRE